jgi:hypothetical protein
MVEATPKPKQTIKQVAQYTVFMDEQLGKGQYGVVCKAKLATEVKDKDAKIYACKIMEITNISQQDFIAIDKEIKIQKMIQSDSCCRLH